MTSELVTPGDEHREEIVGLMRVAINLGAGDLAERAAWLSVEKMRYVLEGDRIVAAAAARDFRQWFGGRELAMSGIWGVVTLPERRGGGLATRAVTELLEEARAKGQPLSVLYPATQRPYRGMGYELASLLTYLRGFRDLGRTLKFTGPPAHPVALLVEEQRVRPAWSFQWMLRLLDAVGALEGHGYPPVSGEIGVSVEDALFPENGCPWRVVAEGGAVSVTPAGVGANRVRPISIGTLSSLYSGFLSAADAVALGLVDEAVAPGLARLFGGPAPWMHDFF